MTTHDAAICQNVQMAAMAHLDGEAGDLSPAEVEAHLADCAACRATVAALATLQPRMNALDYESLDLDVWPGVHRAITSGEMSARTQLQFVIALAAGLALWRVAQLSIGLPAPVVNSVVPLAVTVLVLWRIVGDPFAIQVTAHPLQGEGVR